ncbi:MAG: hypothetical protein KF876_08210 [Nitrospira sp.]|nr:hypothetical protein [Nitrospira sp.]
MGATCPSEQSRPRSIGLAETVCLVDDARVETVLSMTNEAPESGRFAGRVSGRSKHQPAPQMNEIAVRADHSRTEHG